MKPQDYVQKAQAELNKASRKMGQALKLANILPDIEYHRIHEFAYKANISVTFQIGRRELITALFKHLSPEPLAHVKDSCTSFYPMAQVPEDTKANVSTAGPAVWHYDPMEYKHKTHWKWYSLLNGTWIQCKAIILEDGASLVAKHTRDNRGRIIAYNWELLNAPDGLRVKWYPFDKSTGNAFTIYSITAYDLESFWS